MCCFSQPVERVADTSIFARGQGERQFLVYNMSYIAATDLAMVLPLPVPADSPETAVEFIDLQAYPGFFEDLGQGFPPRLAARAMGGRRVRSLDEPRLKVHEVGDFDASFVPRLTDFRRLDERFRIPAAVWERLPGDRRSRALLLASVAAGSFAEPGYPGGGGPPLKPRQRGGGASRPRGPA